MCVYSKIVEEQGPLSIKIIGDSMEPFLKEGDTISIQKVESMKIGKCYVFRYNNKLTLHRLVYKTSESFYFIGDNSSKFESVDRTQIYGVYNEDNRKLLVFISIILVNWLLFICQNVSNPTITRYFCKIRRKIFRIIVGGINEKTV